MQDLFSGVLMTDLVLDRCKAPDRESCQAVLSRVGQWNPGLKARAVLWASQQDAAFRPRADGT